MTGRRRAAVVVASDSVSRGEREDASGRLAVEMLRDIGFEVKAPFVVEDEFTAIANVLCGLADDERVSLVVTTGGTGFSPRDVTPEATRDVVEREAPGFAEAVRSASPSPYGLLTRGVAGARGATLIVNLAGSQGAVKDGIAAVAPGLVHALDLLAGVAGPHPPAG